MQKIKIVSLFCLFGWFVSFSSNAQNVEELVSKYTSENGQKYMQPFADAFSANLNSGLFHNAGINKLGFQIYLGIETQLAVIPSSQKFMTATTEGDYFPSTRVENVPTVFGPSEGKRIEDPNTGLVYVFPGGLDINYVPMITPQLTVGSVYGTDLTIRFAGTKKIEDVGDISLFGWGLRHSIDQYLPLPFSSAIGFYNQRFKFGDYLDASSSIISLQGSFSIQVITLYGGLGYEMGSMKISYEYENLENGQTEEIRFDLTPGNTIRLTTGFGFNLGPVNLHAEYNLAKQSTISAGLGIGFGYK
ncbi:DUF6588 family protein [Natronoflexus pectinivorans]|uniref:Outer membrane protein with beta-barrel domain n=1 Tax=Natronoflexus pectinivorans TaxID=682526 RepID=A0A4R2GDH9_9BACT|nr:DUF6588 family protein [Natronoflexus pectinivorans]TCO06127.1 hypothetical protein EV194_11342 [Natronoflexus pectinivorans]